MCGAIRGGSLSREGISMFTYAPLRLKGMVWLRQARARFEDEIVGSNPTTYPFFMHVQIASSLKSVQPYHANRESEMAIGSV